ncbi:pyridoxamine 5'-phosphate oxidase family protein [Oxalobacteraceae bacterium R-40]|uniref:Pyridoxamine 5'-phosphate oxidase family protein n=1 Tax=Keguizhuia sedimenti TaxID=3064264 RepID=A0ABU1BU93_9BURK|nr:pyridoxamine 5'-phosphate oxidase family protein [Oxalobacteraceae bacterium R-40]
MQIDFSSVITLLHSCPSGVLATHSRQIEGYPYATTLPFVLDELHRPVFLVSALAEHTKNLMSDQRCSLLLSEPSGQQVLKGARITIVGDAERFAATESLINHYLRYQPDAKQYLDLGDFLFFRLIPKRAHYIAGFGQMGWSEGMEWENVQPLSLDQDAHLCHAMMAHLPKGIRLLGIDCFGFDAERDGKRERFQFANAPIAEGNLEDVIRRFLKGLV